MSDYKVVGEAYSLVNDLIGVVLRLDVKLANGTQWFEVIPFSSGSPTALKKKLVRLARSRLDELVAGTSSNKNFR
jgi:hypothetical protein